MNPSVKSVENSRQLPSFCNYLVLLYSAYLNIHETFNINYICDRLLIMFRERIVGRIVVPIVGQNVGHITGQIVGQIVGHIV